MLTQYDFEIFKIALSHNRTFSTPNKITDLFANFQVQVNLIENYCNSFIPLLSLKNLTQNVEMFCMSKYLLLFERFYLKVC